MTRYYTVEKAKFGGTTGTIIPFTIQLPFTNFPDIGNWDTLVPAGYLRCDGSIVQASLFPTLASVIGVGDQCPFAKEPLTDDFFQLPDLGSKYIRCSTSSGQYFDDLVSTSDSNLARVGAEVGVTTLVGEEVEISYTGSFDVLQKSQIEFFGNPTYILGRNGKTFEDSLTEDNFQAHGHDANVGVFTYLGNWTDSTWVAAGGTGDNSGITEGSNDFLNVTQPDGSSSIVKHDHDILGPSSTQLREQNDFQFSYPETQISPDGLKTTISLSTNNVNKLDTAISPYILVEYIIKI